MVLLKSYEMPVALKGSIDEKVSKDVIESVKKLITDNKGEIAAVEDWGRRTLSFPVAKETIGQYFLINFDADPKVLLTLGKKLNLQDGILRYLIIKKELPKKIKTEKAQA